MRNPERPTKDEGHSAGKEQESTRGLLHPPSLSLPKGGGAIRGIGEKFAANPVTGTGSMTVPIATSAGRSGFGPQLSLAYDSSAGNGPFGLGWSLSLPAITRKTDKGLPIYQDANESDVFILSGAEDLVPVLTQNTQGHWVRETLPPRTINGVQYRIQRYRPRIESLFARIERWTNTAKPTDVFWRSITKDNVTTWYGKTAESRIADPADLQRIFSWLICESYDDKGNAIVYSYVPEDDTNVPTQAHERNRVRTANRYLKRIKYGNCVSRLLRPDLAAAQWMFEVVFDYGEHHPVHPKPNDSAAWPVRNDPFSSYRSGFEVRTYRLCRRVLMFHHFAAELNVGADCLVRSTDFSYAHDIHPADARKPIFSLLLSVTHTGYTRQDANSYHAKSLPPVAFTYSEAIIQNDLRELEPSSLDNLPMGIDGSHYQWVDLDGEGLSGILTEQADAWFYKRNLSPLNVVHSNGAAHVEAKFGRLERVATRPTLSLADGAQFLDLAGDGRPDVVQFDGPTPGFYERTLDEQWEPFVAFRALPVVDWQDPNLKFMDLNGDGHADILLTEDNAFTWYGSLGEAGFASAQRVAQPWDEEHGPRVVFADGTQAMYLADMSGDGLTDIVRIRNGEVCYWPNLGYGRFGAKVTMDNAPRFDHPDQFDQRRIRLADIDGSGVTDILYLHANSVSVYFNQSGNSWSIPTVLTQLPAIDNLTGVQVLDLLGNGTACLVWSSPLPGDARRPLRYLDLMGGQKPHLLIKTANNLGAETHVHYAPSTRFYLQDRRDGTPWMTKLPFPVHVVERVETYDHISGNRFVTRYAYHHGYFDGVEREFRGFGRVDQWDTEEFAALNANQQVPVGTNVEASSHVPPVLTRTWFHTGVYLGRDRVSNVFAGLLDVNDKGEYYREPGLSDVQAKQLLLDDTVLPVGWTVEEEREACRALKGAMLRQEVYALDGTDRESHPYTVTEQNFTIERLQPQASNRHAVFFTHAREALSYHYERDPADPRLSHALTLDVDAFGNVLKSATIGYGRRQTNSDPTLEPRDQAKQSALLITYTENDVTNPVEADDDYRTPLPSESRTYELTGLVLPAGRDRFTFAEVLNAGTGAVPIAYEQEPIVGVRHKRLIEQVRTLYRSNDLTGPLPLGTLQALALPFESYKLALTPELLAEVYGGRVTNAMLTSEGRYVHSEGDANWWIPSGRMFYTPDPAATSQEELDYARALFFLPHRYRDPFHTPLISTETFVTYDSYDLLTQETRDPLGNRVTVGERSVDPTQPLVRHGQDYRVLQPALIMDPNRNRSAVAFDALGMVVGTAVMGKPEDSPVPGDRLEATFRTDLTQTETNQFFTQPTGPIAATLLDQATTRIVYDLERFRRTRAAHPDDPTQWLPPCAATLARETHVSDLATNQQTRIQISFSYSDGFGREIQKKLRAEPGPVPRRNPATGRILTVNGQPEMTPHEVSPRWVGSGWTVFNNKGKPVRQYEPFFTDTHRFEFDVRIGVSPVLFYDPVERVVATLHPNHTWEKVVFDPWHQATWDVSDTVLVADPKTDADVGDFLSRLPDAEYIPTWHTQRQGGALGPQEQAATRKAAMHARTPTMAHFDSLGRTFLTVAHNKFKYSNTPLADPPTEEFHRTRTVFDIEGNQRQVIDALNRLVMRYDYDMLGTRIHQASMEAGKRWMLNDVAGKPIRTWDSRAHQFHIAYDSLQRPTESYLRQGAGDALLVERTVYGETRSNPEASNLRGQVIQHFDQAGIVTSDDYDFKSNLLRSQRQLAQKYHTTLDWTIAEPLEAPIYTSRTRYDALNRPIQLIAPHSDQPGTNINIIQPGYNEANLLEQVHAWLNQPMEPSSLLDPATANLHAVTDIDYDAKGQRTLIDYGNGVRTTYTYDPLTFRLVHLLTRRDAVAFLDDCPQSPLPDWPGCQVQNLHYTYDPAGNITHIHDDAQQTIYFRNQRIEPSAAYTYDALYRLIEATGREHIGQTGRPWTTFDDAGRVNLPHPHEGQAMRNYTEQYLYDAVGNFGRLSHRAVNGNWIRSYEYHEASMLEPARQSNRLSRTVIHPNGLQPIPEPYTHDPHGNMIRMPHFVNHPNPDQPNMHWDSEDQLQSVDLDGSGRAYYVYDAGGERVRKVVQKNNGIEERIYLGGFEIFRQRNGNGVKLERETLHIMDDKQRSALVETKTITNPDDDSADKVIRYQFGNHLGSASLELDDKAIVISYEEYYPYGSTSYQAVNQSIRAAAKRYRYTGKERDEETGLNYHGARYSAPWLGCWTSPDPAEGIDGLNRYTYVRNNPIRLFDPNGRWGKDMHFAGVYWSGRLAGATHDTALVAAIASQSPDDFTHTKAPEVKVMAALLLSGRESSSVMTWINNMHGLHLTRTESEVVTRAGIHTKDPILFGLGLHTRGDRLPHADLEGKWTAGHQVGLNENFTSSHYLSTAADETFRNPGKALATFERFRELWRQFGGEYGSTAPLTKGQLQQLSKFIYARTDKEKLQALTQGLLSSGVSPSEAKTVESFLQSEDARREAWQHVLGTPQGQRATGVANALWLTVKWNPFLFNRTNNIPYSHEFVDITDELRNLPQMPVDPRFDSDIEQNLFSRPIKLGPPRQVYYH